MIPRLKDYRATGGCYRAPRVLFPHSEDGKAAARLLGLFLPALAVGAGDGAQVALLGEAHPTGGYRLSVTAEGIRIGYGDYEGLRNAVATLAALCEDGGFPCAEITDAPSFGFRSAMLDLARGYVELPVLYEHLLRMAFLKYNVVHLHLMDNESYVMESRVVPNPNGHRQYTQDELREVCDYCRLLGLLVIPEIEFPTHATNLLLALLKHSCCAERGIRAARALFNYDRDHDLRAIVGSSAHEQGVVDLISADLCRTRFAAHRDRDVTHIPTDG